ncbi:MAG TPA: amidohydrolase [Thermomicrobiales bacterium]|nr:amidohydrolase [Thermomicrobiales bacterium]
MRHQELKQRVNDEIDRHAEQLIAVGEDIFRHPELGFNERRTAGVVAREFSRLGLSYLEDVALTGLKTLVSGSDSSGPTVAVLGELDSILVADHPHADPATGAAHACGHNAQITAMLGVATGLARSGVLDELAGNVALLAVPAEEYVEIDYRVGLRAQGATEFLGGKSEWIRLGVFDDIDITMMVHAASDDPGGVVGSINTSCNGFIGKQARFIGRAAHAGGAPERGVNALYAAEIALAAINAQRETFRDDDTVRVHPILTRGGDLVNVIPNDVRFETMVRGKTVDAIDDAARKVDRALRAGAVALGARVDITTLPGYLPVLNHRPVVDVFRENFLAFHPASAWGEAGHGTWSGDLGDVSHIMPAIVPQVAGFGGAVHGSDWRITDPYLAYILPAKLMAMTVIDLLADGASGARDILDAYTPAMTKDEYLVFMRRNNRHEQFDGAMVGVG